MWFSVLVKWTCCGGKGRKEREDLLGHSAMKDEQQLGSLWCQEGTRRKSMRKIVKRWSVGLSLIDGCEKKKVSVVTVRGGRTDKRDCWLDNSEELMKKKKLNKTDTGFEKVGCGVGRSGVRVEYRRKSLTYTGKINRWRKLYRTEKRRVV